MLLMLSAVAAAMFAPSESEPEPARKKSPAAGCRRRSVLFHTVRGNPFFLGVARRGGLEQGMDQALVAFDPVRDQHPFRAVPLLDPDLARTFMVVAGGLDFRQQAGGAQLLQAGIGDVQVFQSPTHVFAA